MKPYSADSLCVEGEVSGEGIAALARLLVDYALAESGGDIRACWITLVTARRARLTKRDILFASVSA
jgi:hypothetical protein